MEIFSLLIGLALILVGALLGGRLASALHLPKVTGYLLAGLLAGPSLAHWTGLPPLLSTEVLEELRIVSEVGLALILMNIGAQFRTEHLRRWGGRILRFSLAETGVTFLLVGLSATAINYFILEKILPGWSLAGTSLALGVVFGSISMTTAPAATLMVIREYESEGPVTNALMTLIGLNNLATILLFTLCVHLLGGAAIQGHLVLQLLLPLAGGAASGFLLSIWAQRLELPSEQKLLLLGGVTAVAGASRLMGLNPLLACFALGMVLANSSPRWHRLQESLREIDYPLYVAFFVLAGAKLHLEILFHIGVLGIAYVAARALGKWAGASLGSRWGGFGSRERMFLPLTLFSQGGVAIGLSLSLGFLWPDLGLIVEPVILGSVVFFELVGPLAVRYGLVRSGEVPLLTALAKRAPQGAVEGLHSVVHHFRSSLGLPAWHKVQTPGDILVRHLMRQNVETVQNRTPFNELLRQIAHSRYDRFPVVDEGGRFLGMIDYTEIRNLLLEPALAGLVVASDLISPAIHLLHPDSSLSDVLKIMEKQRNVSFFPVVDPQDPQRLLGILSQNDVLAAFRRLR